MLLILSKVLIVFIYIGIGLAAYRLRILPEESAPVLNSLIMEITVPCLVISSITGNTLDSAMRVNTIITLVLTSAMYAVVACITTFVSDRVFTGREQQDRNVLASAMTGCNSGFMGFPVARAVFGAEVFYYMVIQNISNNLYLFVMSFVQLHHREKTESSGSHIREMFRPLVNTTSIVTVVSVIMLFTGIQLPSFAMEIFTTVGDITIPLSMMMVGVRLGGSDFRRVLGEKDLLITSMIKLIGAPAVVMLLMIPLPVDPIVKLTTLLGTCFPSAVIGVSVAVRENKNSQLMAEAVACSTILSMISLPIWIMICSRLYL